MSPVLLETDNSLSPA